MTDDDCTKMQKMQFFKQSYKNKLKLETELDYLIIGFKYFFLLEIY